MKRTLNKFVLGGLLLGSMVLGGCAKNSTTAGDDFFLPEQQRRLHDFVDAQVRSGAQEDATIQTAHFTGAKLNSLGTQKLALLVPSDVDSDVTVYVNLPADGTLTPARTDAVKAYFVDAGLDLKHVKLEAGENPNTTTPAAEGLARLPRTESAEDGGGSAPAASSK